MAKRQKDRLYYEISREKPFGMFQMILVGGSAGSVMGFLVASLVGAYEGLEMDALVLSFLVACILGFVFGAILTWLLIRYFGKWIAGLSLAGDVSEAELLEKTPKPEGQSESAVVLEDNDSLGKSVDFVFPELSPDKQ